MKTITFIRSIILLVMITTLTTHAMAQELKEDIEQMYAAYNAADQWAMSITSITYQGDIADGEKNVINGAFKTQGDKQWYKVGPSEMLLNDDFLVYVVHSEKVIIVKKIEDAKDDFPSMEYSPHQLSSLLDSTLTLLESIEFLGFRNGVKEYMTQLSDEMIRGLQVGFDENSHVLRRLVYHFHNGPYDEAIRTTVEYDNVDLNPVFTSKDFSHEPYFTVADGNYVASAAFSDYRIVDYGQE